MRPPTPPTEPILFYNRAKGALEEERVYRRAFMDFMYGSALGLTLTEWLFKRRLFTRLYTLDRRSRRSRHTIQGFVERYGLDASEFARPIESYASFNDFFKRDLKPGARPLDPDPGRLISPGDGKLLALPITGESLAPIKGMRLSVEALLGARTSAQPYQGGLCLILRLCPPDYHRFCFIDEGDHGPVHQVGGSHYSVSPLAQRLGLPVFSENHRAWCQVETRHFGPVIQMEVGSFSVGKIGLHTWRGGPCARGQEKGWFEFGASTLVLLFTRDKVRIDSDIWAQSRGHIETQVRMGEGIGRQMSAREHTP